MDDELKQIFIEEIRENTHNLDNQLLELEKGGANVDKELINEVFRKVHSVKGASGSYGYKVIMELSHAMEAVLSEIREGKMVPKPNIIDALLTAYDRLGKLIDDLDNSNDADVSDMVSTLKSIPPRDTADETEKPPQQSTTTTPPPAAQSSNSDTAEKTHRYRITVDLRQFFDKNSIYDRLQELQTAGDIENGDMDISGIDRAVKSFAEFQFDVVPVYFDYTTALTQEQLTDRFSLMPDNILKLDKEEEPSTPDTAAPAASASQEGASDTTADNAPTDEHQQRKTTTLRVNIDTLDTLLNLTSELIMRRNQLYQLSQTLKDKALNETVEEIKTITSSLQENVMKTRLSPIKNLFSQFPVIVRKLARKGGKNIEFLQEGENVELDRALIDSMFDPLLHLVRNAVDHGIETPEERKNAGKEEGGYILFKAFNEGGQINLEIHDDGRGMDPAKIRHKAVEKEMVSRDELETMTDMEVVNLVFQPGMSTAAEVSDISGRGVGMDVVLTNFKKMGGTVNIDTKFGRGTIVKIKLPLTLLILQAIIAETAGRKFVVPETEVVEIVRLKDSSKIDIVYDQEVLQRRDELLPLVRLSSLLKIDKTVEVTDPDTEETTYISERRRLNDRRDDQSDDQSNDQPDEPTETLPANSDTENTAAKLPAAERRAGRDRRRAASRCINLLILNANNNKFGLIVDKIDDIEEVVVKPLGYHFKNIKVFSGIADIGDGNFGLILDIVNLAALANFSFTKIQQTRDKLRAQKQQQVQAVDSSMYLLFKLGDTRNDVFSLNMEAIEHIIKIDASEISSIGNRSVVNYLDHSVPVIFLDAIMPVEQIKLEGETYVVLLKKVKSYDVGIVCKSIVGIQTIENTLDTEGVRYDGISGSKLLEDHIVQFIDTGRVLELSENYWDNGHGRTVAV